MCIRDRHMPVPTKDLFLEIANDCFSLWNFPNCLGCLDGKHVRIKLSLIHI